MVTAFLLLFFWVNFTHYFDSLRVTKSITNNRVCLSHYTVHQFEVEIISLFSCFLLSKLLSNSINICCTCSFFHHLMKSNVVLSLTWSLFNSSKKQVCLTFESSVIHIPTLKKRSTKNPFLKSHSGKKYNTHILNSNRG